LGNSLFGQYGQNFTSNDGVSFMIVALTARHFRDLAELTGTAKAVAAVAEALGADFTDEGQRYEHRDVLSGLFAAWFRSHTADDITAALSASSVLWDRYQSFTEVAWTNRGSGRISLPGCRCRSTVRTPHPSPHRPWVTTPPPSWQSGWD